MKKLIKLIAITALVTVIGFAFTACDDGNNNNENNTGGNTGTTGTVPTLTSITAVYTPTTEIFPDTTHDTLKEDLTVKAHYSDSTSKTLNEADYTLNGELAEGESVITVNYTEGGVTKTTTFKVTVDAPHAHIWSLWATITPATCTIEGKEKRTCSASPTHDEEKFIPIDLVNGHAWETTFTTIAATDKTNGIKRTTCTRDNSHTKDEFSGEYATGTAGLDFTGIYNSDTYTGYRVANKSTGNGTATGDIVIPAYYRPDADSPYLPVTVIGLNLNDASHTQSQNAFGGTSPSNHNTTLTGVTFAEGSQLTTITNFAFVYCDNLASVTLPASLTSIGNNVFAACTSLTSITIPASVTSIGQFAFSGCSSLASVTFAGTIPSSGFNASAFPPAHMGDLRDKFYATDSENGTPGTYIATSGSGTTEDPFVWTKQ